MDDDGDTDVLSASSGDNKIAWYENLSPITAVHGPITKIFEFKALLELAQQRHGSFKQNFAEKCTNFLQGPMEKLKMKGTKMENGVPPLAQRIKQTPSSATVRIADIATDLKSKDIAVLDFSAGRAAEHSPDYINQAASQALLTGDTHQTKAQGKHDYLEMVARKLERENNLSLDPDKSIMATMGCKNGLTLALLAIIGPGDEVIVEDPCFVSYQATIGVCGGVTVPVPIRRENRFRWTHAELEAAVTERTRCILLCSPQNPTGTVHTEEDLDMIAAVAQKHNLWVICDEIYERVTWKAREHICLATRPGMQERTIGLMGFTKTFSMGGWRIGFMYAPESIISAAVIFQQHLMTCAGSFTQAGAAFALAEEYRPEVMEMWVDWEKRCDTVATEINKIPGLSCLPPEGGFYAWINIAETGEKSEAFAERMLRDQHIALVPGAPFGASGDDYVRMTCVKSWADLHLGLTRIRQGL
ncbi:MAG: aminotransferase class I/II-fold pyridoxal phosphate-dependent enzyme [Caldithrix sp.]|nr:MAG: aminotransferase class I/II-fold pyridoxal phosphate-dependent enzyme [Caldithrix sp.]